MQTRRRAILLVLALVSPLACGQLEEKSASSASAQGPHSESATWVSIFDPSKAASGYTLAFHRRHVPVIFDMNGRVVHSWPESRVKSRLRLLKDGSLLPVSRGRAIFEYDGDGNLVWEWYAGDHLVSHSGKRRSADRSVAVTNLGTGEPVGRSSEAEKVLGSAVERPTEEFVYWTNPRIRAADDARSQESIDHEPGDLIPKQEEVEMEHLRALGYVE